MNGKLSKPEPVQISDELKLRLLNNHRISADDPMWKSLDETRWCLHCVKVFTGRSVRVYQDEHFRDGYSLQCGTPGCDGSPIDWDLPDSDFAVGVTRQEAHPRPAPKKDDPIHSEDTGASEQNPAYEDCGTYGPGLSVVPKYSDEAQRLRLRSLLWREPKVSGGDASGVPAFLLALCQGAKAGMHKAYTLYLTEKIMEPAQISFPARASATDLDEREPTDIIPEQFWVEVEYDEYEGSGLVSLIPSFDKFDELLFRIANEQSTAQFLVEEIRGSINTYLAQAGATDEKLDWEIQVEEMGG